MAVEVVFLWSDERRSRKSIMFSSSIHQAIGQLVLESVASTESGSEKKSIKIDGVLIFMGEGISNVAGPERAHFWL